MSKSPSFCDPTRNPIYGMLEDLLRELDRIKNELEALDLDNVADKIANDLRKELEARLSDIEEKILRIEQAIADIDIDQLVKDIEESILEQLDPIKVQIDEIQQQLNILKQGLIISEAWSWSEDGTDRFTTEYPKKNLWDGTITTARTERNSDGRHIKHTINTALGSRISIAGNRFIEADLTHQARAHTGKILLNGIPLRSDQVPARFAGSNSTSNGFRLIYNNYDLETGEFQTVYSIFSTNHSAILDIPFSIGVISTGDVLDIYDLKIEFIDSGTSNQTRAQGIYTTPEELDPLNAFPQYHAYALQKFTTPERYSRFEFTREAIKLLQQQQNDEINHLARRITGLGG